MAASRHDVTNALEDDRAGTRDAFDRVLPLLYEEMKRITRNQLSREATGHTLSTTGLVHEAYLKLVDQRRATWVNREQLLAMAAVAMRRILVDYARRHKAGRRGGPDRRVVSLDGGDEGGVVSPLVSLERSDTLLALDEALERLGRLSPELARIVEYRFFAGMSEKDTADALGLSPRTVARKWGIAKGWLHQELRFDERSLGRD